MAKTKQVKIDKSSFNATHFDGWSEADFIKHELPSVPDFYGNEAKKKEFLKEAFAAVQKANGVEKATEKPKK